MAMRLGNAVDWTGKATGRSSISSQVAPTDAERRLLESRRNIVAASLQPARPEEIGRMIASLRMVMPSHDSSDPALTVKLYQTALASFPEWAIAQVCRAFLEGRAGGSTTFAPTPADIAARCAEIVLPHKEEMASVGRILNAEVIHTPTDDERQRVGEGLRALAARIGQQEDAEEAERRKRLSEAFRATSAEARRRELRHAGIDDGRDLSLGYRQSMGLVGAMSDRRARDDMDERQEQDEHAEVRS